MTVKEKSNKGKASEGKAETSGKKQKSRPPYINLCQDAMFKAFFSKDERLLQSIVQTFIRLPEGKTVKSLKIKDKGEKDWLKFALPALKDPARYPKFTGGKGIVLDMLAVLNTGEIIHIEMQTVPHAHFMERTLYYWSEVYGGEFKSGESYGTLKPAYSLIFARFPLFSQSEELINSFSIRSDRPPHFVLTNHFGMTYVDLSRFYLPEGGPEALVDMVSAWCYFISGSAVLSDRGRAALFQINEEVFKMADTVLKDLSVEGELRILEKFREKQLHDQVSDLEYATQKGREEGLKKGIAKGIEKGIEKGIAKGREEFIVNMLRKKCDVSLISEVTGLPKAEIIKFKADKFL